MSKVVIRKSVAQKLIAGKSKSFKVTEDISEKGKRRLNLVYRKSGKAITVEVR